MYYYNKAIIQTASGQPSRTLVADHRRGQCCFGSPIRPLLRTTVAEPLWTTVAVPKLTTVADHRRRPPLQTTVCGPPSRNRCGPPPPPSLEPLLITVADSRRGRTTVAEPWRTTVAEPLLITVADPLLTMHCRGQPLRTTVADTRRGPASRTTVADHRHRLPSQCCFGRPITEICQKLTTVRPIRVISKTKRVTLLTYKA